MTTIPAQLQHAEYRFVRISGRTKKAMDKDWANTGALTFDSPKLVQHIQAGNNYGVVGGHGDLIVIDFDDAAIQAAVSARLPPTFTVRTGGKGLHHYYYRMDKPFSGVVNDAQGKRVMDLQGPKHQVVGPGSINGDTGRAYEVTNDSEVMPIRREALTRIIQETVGLNVTITADTLEEMMLDSIASEVNKDRMLRSPTVMEIKQKVKISDYLRELNIDNVPTSSSGVCMCPLGHESVGRQCLSFNDVKGVWYCHHCRRNGDIFTLYALVNKMNSRTDFRVLIGRMANKYGIEIKRTESENEDDVGVANYVTKDIEKEKRNKDGTVKVSVETMKYVVPTPIIVENMLHALDGWPKLLNNVPFVMVFDNAKNMYKPLRRGKPSELFGFISSKLPCRWTAGNDAEGMSFITKEEFITTFPLIDAVDKYKCISCAPHEPPFPFVYYHDCEMPKDYTPTGEYLERFLDFFNNADTPFDRDILRAVVLTLVWGTRSHGKRPVFLFTSPDSGCGKSMATEKISNLVGGHIKIEAGIENIDMVNRLIGSSEYDDLRVVRVDNVEFKSKSFTSSADFQSLITNSWLKGRVLNNDDVGKPNIYTWFITSVGMSYEDDTSKRLVPILLKRITWESQTSWEADIDEYTQKYRMHVLADAIALLRGPQKSFDRKHTTRWYLWESDVLSRCTNDFAGTMMLIKARRREANNDDVEASTIMNALREAAVHPSKFTHRLDSEEGGSLFTDVKHESTHQPTGEKRISLSDITMVYSSLTGSRSLTTRGMNIMLKRHYDALRFEDGVTLRMWCGMNVVIVSDKTFLKWTTDQV